MCKFQLKIRHIALYFDTPHKLEWYFFVKLELPHCILIGSNSIEQRSSLILTLELELEIEIGVINVPILREYI